ncbi:MAG: SecD/SecF fusion protein, partial [Solirubrobacterales bacterium]|nr:SecD/SecF fusion protein [Solirubrobacterales bacterium]
VMAKPTVLGLDLKGGTQLVYVARPTPQEPVVTADDIERSISIIRERADKLGVSEPEISRVGSDEIQVGLPNVANAKRAIDQIGTTSQLYLYDFERNVIPPPHSSAPKDPTTAVAQDPTVYSFPNLYEAVKFAHTQKPNCFKKECTTTGPTYYLFNAQSHAGLGDPAERPTDIYRQLQLKPLAKPKGDVLITVPQGTVVLSEAATDNPNTPADESQTGAPHYYVMRDRPALTGSEITNPKQNFDPTTNQPLVSFDFTSQGRAAFQKVTSQIAQRGLATAPPAVASAQADAYSQHFAVVLDGEIKSSPIINFVDNPDGIDGRTGAEISGNFTIQSAQDLASFLQIGAIPVNLHVISQSTVSATLGQQALDQGLKAGLIGLVVVIAFLILYYRLLGLVAVIGLAVYALFFFALIKLIPVTLTLPGIAGLVLTIGVAADANIVIFERIKEELRAGRSALSAIGQGYRHGIATIIDANVITLLTAFILFGLATAGVKGFAFTLGVGTIVSLFTAVLFTQAFLGLFSRSRALRSPWALGAGERHFRWKFDFTGASKWFFSMSGAILAIGAISLAVNQLNFGIDFESGTRVEAGLVKPATIDQVRTALADANIGGAGSAEIQSIQNQTLGQNAVQIQAQIPQPDVNKVPGVLKQAFGLKPHSFQSTTVGPTFGAQVARSAVVAVLFSLLVISIYVALRFEAKYAIPVLIALAHDVLITAGVYSVVGREVTSGTVAAFLTILGYSMYDTIIVFDRIRENVPRMPRAAFSQIVNRSMSEVLTRSLITGLSTVFLVTVLFIFGGATLKDFAFAMMIGVLSGAYSSIFIASPVLTHWKEREPAYRSRRQRLEAEMGFVPTFPEDNVVAKTDGVAAPQAPAAPAPRRTPAVPAPAPPPAALPEPVADDGNGGEPDALDVEPVGTGAGAEPRSDRPSRSERERRRRQQRARRKHGRNR